MKLLTLSCLRHLSWVLLLLIASTQFAACATAKFTCNEEHCPNGCCDKATGKCMVQSDQYCGTAGKKCVDCGDLTCNTGPGKCYDASCGDCPSGQTCNALTKMCEGTVFGCDNCQGSCCTEETTCNTVQTDTACGIDGEACVNCRRSNLTCNKLTGKCGADPCVGKCQGESDGQGGYCELNSCTGCCTKTVPPQCVLGTIAAYCGSKGLECQACGTLEKCSNRECVGTGTCDAAHCPTGCCKNNICHVGTENAYCGKNGATCDQCDGTTTWCMEKACLPCKYWCPGCCGTATVQKLGRCYWGTQDIACGIAGADCVQCSGSTPSCACGTCKASGTHCVACCNWTAKKCWGGIGNDPSACGNDPKAPCVNCTEQGKSCVNVSGSYQCQ